LGQTEIQDLDCTVGFDLDVARLEIAMDDTLFVRGFKCARNLLRDTQCFAQRQRTIRRGSLDELHHQIVGPHIVERTDVGMVQRGHCAGFAIKTFAEALGGNFDRYVSPEPRVAGQIHFAHPSGAD
jgi:hypothetical protein